MLALFRKLIAEMGEGGKPPSRFDEGDYRLAAAALLVHAATIDGYVTERERAKLHSLIQQRFGLDDVAAAELVAEAAAAERQSVDLYRFTHRLTRSLDEAGRARVVEMMWQIVCVDGKVTEFEDNLIWRAADLLGVSRDQHGALRERMAGGNALKQGEG
jgi:uncharacterized tellurite resistance protein B-like protein